MLRNTILAATALVINLVTINSAPAAEPATKPHGQPQHHSTTTGSATQGKSEYTKQCASCHDGGAAGPVLIGLFKRHRLRDKKHTPLTDASVRSRIVEGGEGMPPFVSLKTKQLDDLIAYLKTL